MHLINSQESEKIPNFSEFYGRMITKYDEKTKNNFKVNRVFIPE